jgi:hypothetical protein
MAKHSVQVQISRRLIQSPQGFRIIGIEFEELSKESLRNLTWRQIHAVQSTKQRQQIHSGCFQTRAKVNRNAGRSAMGHGPSMAHYGAEVNRQPSPRDEIWGTLELTQRNHPHPI